MSFDYQKFNTEDHGGCWRMSVNVQGREVDTSLVLPAPTGLADTPRKLTANRNDRLFGFVNGSLSVSPPNPHPPKVVAFFLFSFFFISKETSVLFRTFIVTPCLEKVFYAVLVSLSKPRTMTCLTKNLCH